MRLLICGDRDWTDYEFILEELRLLVFAQALVDPNTKVFVIDGAAPGADTWGHMAAKKLGCDFKRFPADWDKYGNYAGPLRNQQMLDEGHPDLVWAFHDNLDSSKGTKDMVRRAERAKIPVVKFTHQGRS